MSDEHSRKDSRLQDALGWAAGQGIRLRDVQSASEDASFRRYFRARLTAPLNNERGNLDVGESVILMDAPADLEDSRPFVAVAQLLEGLGVAVPMIFAMDLERGFLLLSDLGHQSLLGVLEQEPALADLMYDRAGGWIHRMQAIDHDALSDLPDYDDAMLRREMQLFPDWLCKKHLRLDWDASDNGEWSRLTDTLVKNSLSQPCTLVHRDYHSRNLMVDADFEVSVIDFQDAVAGPFTYDLVSMLRDCYIDWPLDQTDRWALRWFNDSPLAAPFDEAQCLRWFYLTGVQRQLKAAGIFARLALRDDKWGYLPDIPRTLGYISAVSKRYPELQWIDHFIRQHCLPGLLP
ncbi:MAG: aminoglycoside phosphotransferase family protein [Woeseiaceae bacterium]